MARPTAAGGKGLRRPKTLAQKRGMQTATKAGSGNRGRPFAGYPGSRGKAPVRSGGFKPNVKVGMPDLSGVGKAVGDTIRKSVPQSSLIDQIGNRIKSVTGQK